MAHDLFGDNGHDSRVARKAKPKTKKPLSATGRAEHAFREEFREAHPGVPLLFREGRDRKILADLLRLAQDEDLVVGWLIPEFFRTQDPAITRFIRNYDVRDLAFVAQRLLLKRSGRKQLHPRTAENLHEARKAMGEE